MKGWLFGESLFIIVLTTKGIFCMGGSVLSHELTSKLEYYTLSLFLSHKFVCVCIYQFCSIKSRYKFIEIRGVQR